MLKKTPLSVTDTSASTIMQWYDDNQILLVDVREVAEFEKEHIPGALLLPLSSFDPELFPVLNGKKVVLYCAIGKRSEAAGKMLLKEGHLDVYHMVGGISAWKAEGFETEEQFLPPEAPKEPEAPVFLCPPPGQVLRDDYLAAFGIAPGELAKSIGISEDVIDNLLETGVPVGVELSMRLARYFCTASDFWVRLQLEHDLEQTRYNLGEKIRTEVAPRAVAA